MRQLEPTVAFLLLETSCGLLKERMARTVGAHRDAVFGERFALDPIRCRLRTDLPRVVRRFGLNHDDVRLAAFTWWQLRATHRLAVLHLRPISESRRRNVVAPASLRESNVGYPELLRHRPDRLRPHLLVQFLARQSHRFRHISLLDQ